MKKSILIFVVLAMPILIMAQDNTKQKEVGLVFNNFDNFGLTYRIGNEKNLWRINTTVFSVSNYEIIDENEEEIQSNINFGINFGKEYRQNIKDNYEIRNGVDLSFRYSHLKRESDDLTIPDNDYLRESTTYQPGINLIMGVNYLINENFIFGAELLPSIGYRTGTDKYKYNIGEDIESDISGFNYGLSNSSALISLAYRF